MTGIDPEAEGPDEVEISLEGRVKALEIIVLLMLRDIAKDERKAHNLISGLRHLARELHAHGEPDAQVRHLIEARTALLERLAAKYREESFA